MQAYRQGYCENGSQQQMYRSSSSSSSSQSYGAMYQGSGGMHQGSGAMMHQGSGAMYQGSGGMHQGAGAMVHQGGGAMYQASRGMHQGAGGMYQGGGGGGMMHKSSSMSSSQYSQSSMTVFGQDAFCEIMPSAFPPGTDPKIIECYNRIDRDGNGLIDDQELMSVLSNCSHNFNMRTVHLLMYQFTHSNKRMLGPKEFVPLLKCLQTWRAMFQRYDMDRNGTIDSSELGQALCGLGYRVSPVIINLLVAKFSKAGGRCALQYDSFIECCLTVKGLTETFNAKAVCGKATFCYEEFLLNVLPFVIA